MERKAKRIAIVHGLMHTKRRWEHLAGCFANGESLQLPMRRSTDLIALSLAPMLLGYDILIGHSMGGLVIHKAVDRYLGPGGIGPRPEKIFYVSTPFQGVKVPSHLSPLLKVPKSREMIRAFSLLTVTYPQFVDDIMLDDVMSQDFDLAVPLLRELARYRSEPQAIQGVESFHIVAGKDHLARPSYLPGARNIIFRSSGHTIPLEQEERFVRLVKHLGQTR